MEVQGPAKRGTLGTQDQDTAEVKGGPRGVAGARRHGERVGRSGGASGGGGAGSLGAHCSSADARVHRQQERAEERAEGVGLDMRADMVREMCRPRREGGLRFTMGSRDEMRDRDAGRTLGAGLPGP